MSVEQVHAGSETGPAASSDGDEESALSRDQVFDILSSQRRRHALHFLKRRNGDGTELGELSEQIAAWENGKPVDRVTSPERRRVYTSLQQYHLPKLHTNGVVEYDSRRGVVELTERTTDFDVYFDVVTGHDIPWSLYYAGLSGVSLGVIAAVWAGIYPFALLPDLAWGLFTATVFAVSALAHVSHDRRMRLGTAGPPPERRER